LKWTDPTTGAEIRLHGPTSNAAAGSNSASGWVLRVMDGYGNYYDDFGNPVSRRANDGHIPIFGNSNAQ
jgi:YD repeat-containing protein